jgi:hypothetical protein
MKKRTNATDYTMAGNLRPVKFWPNCGTGAFGKRRPTFLVFDPVDVCCYHKGCESQFEPESAERAAAVAWHGGRVLICIQYFIKPHRQTRRWVFCLVKQERCRHNY